VINSKNYCRRGREGVNKLGGLFFSFVVDVLWALHGGLPICNFVNRLPYKEGLPDGFTWFCDETWRRQECVKVRDFKTGRIVVWPHRYG
jgi:hypothetical protein